MTTQLITDYSLERQGEAFAAFMEDYPHFNAEEIDRLRTTDYHRLDKLHHIYLDYTGGGLYSESQLQQHMELLQNGVYGNPHSSNPTSLAATHLTEQAREAILQFFNASPDEYLVIFTMNASGALKLIGEAYPFEPGANYLLTFDNHNSVNGIREFAHGKGAKVTYSPVVSPDMRLDEASLLANLERVNPNSHNLFAYPAQSNFSGVQHSLEWIEIAHHKGWDVVVDCAAFAPTNRLDLSRWKPDFVPLSFYKIFGYPTGVGALLVRRAILSRLRRPWFAGGTVQVTSVQAGQHILAEGSSAFEDGTIDYLNLPAVEIGLRYIQQLGLDSIHDRVAALAGWMLQHLVGLRHSNGRPLVRIYGPTTMEQRGGSLALNFFDPDGSLIDYKEVESRANARNISLRTGCFCNPGAGELALHIPVDAIKSWFKEHQRLTFKEYSIAMSALSDDGVGAVRISVGLATNFADVYQFLNFAASFLDERAE